MARTNEKRDRRRELAVAALLETATIEEAARVSSVGLTTLYRWLREDAEFQSAYRDAKRRALDQAIARLHAISGEAVETLRTVMKDEDAPASARVTAARTVLELATKSAEADDLAARVAELERLVSNQNQGRTA